MHCLLDKVTARHIMEGMLKLIEGRTITSAELFALYFYQRARSDGITFDLAKSSFVGRRWSWLFHF